MISKAKYIDPIIGTVGDAFEQSFHGGGKVHPGACLPAGMVQLSPDTVTGGDNGSGYHYCHKTIEGFSFNHMSGSGWYGDLGNLQIMPVIGETDLRSGSNEEIPFNKGTVGWKSEFSHENEIAKAGYYSVCLQRYSITAEATVTPHTGLLRFTYPKSNDARILFNFSRRIAGHADFEHIDIINDRCIEGYIKCTPAGGGFGRGDGNISYTLYFVCELSKPCKWMRFFSNEVLCEEELNTFEHEDVGLIASYSTANEEQIVLRCGISYTDLEGARNNLRSECSNFDFDKIASDAFAKWEEVLDTVNVEGNDQTDLILFYTCMYHTFLDPRTAVDVDFRYKGPDGVIRKADYNHRTMFSGWDVYRSEFPLLTITSPQTVNDEVNTLLNIADISGTSFPQWELMGIDSKCMIGDPGLLVVADAYVKGIRDYDIEKAYKIAISSCLSKTELDGKPFKSLQPTFKQFAEDCFVPGNLSSTLEFLLADFAMNEFAKNYGKLEDSKQMLKKVKRYKENYNPKIGFMAPKNEDGEFINIKDEYDETGCIESNILQQSFFAPYDVEGLADLFGRERFIEILEKFFSEADFSRLWNINYNHSNEPCHNITHYFNFLNLPRRTQYWTRRVQKEAYRLGAFGYCGNEDVGQISAWYVLSACGFAQVCPSKPEYAINTPLFKSVEIKLDSKYHSCSISNTFKIECDCDPLDYQYIDKIYLNGELLDRYYITYDEITSGGILSFKLAK